MNKSHMNSQKVPSSDYLEHVLESMHTSSASEQFFQLTKDRVLSLYALHYPAKPSLAKRAGFVFSLIAMILIVSTTVQKTTQKAPEQELNTISFALEEL